MISVPLDLPSFNCETTTTTNSSRIYSIRDNVADVDHEQLNLQQLIQEVENHKKWKRETGIPALKRMHFLENVLKVYETELSEFKRELNSLKSERSKIQDLHELKISCIRSTSKIIHRQNIHLQKSHDSHSEERRESHDKIECMQERMGELQALSEELTAVNNKYRGINEQLRMEHERDCQITRELRSSILDLQNETYIKEEENIEQHSTLVELQQQIMLREQKISFILHQKNNNNGSPSANLKNINNQKCRRRTSASLLSPVCFSSVDDIINGENDSGHQQQSTMRIPNIFGITPTDNDNNDDEEEQEERNTTRIMMDFSFPDNNNNNIHHNHNISCVVSPAGTFLTMMLSKKTNCDHRSFVFDNRALFELELREKIESELRQKYEMENAQIRVEEHLKMNELSQKYIFQLQRKQAKIERLEKKLNNNNSRRSIKSKKNNMSDDSVVSQDTQCFCIQQ